LEQSSYQQIETTIKQWAQRETAVSAILLISSRARQNPLPSLPSSGRPQITAGLREIYLMSKHV